MTNVPRAKTFVDDTGQHPHVVDRTTSDRDVTDLWCLDVLKMGLTAGSTQSTVTV
jgi:hypothetical protein